MRMFKLSFFLVVLFSAANGHKDVKYHSQWGQDRYLNEHIFNNKVGGVFVDIGAHDGITLSNTYFFEKNINRTGVAFEPLSGPYEKLKASRKCVCINAAVAAERGSAAFSVRRDMRKC